MKEKGILAALFPKSASQSHIERRISEIEDLCGTLSIEVAETIVQKIGDINPATFMGIGKVGELRDAASKLKAKVMIISTEISPMQLRNLEKMLGMKVIDRNELILSIFAKNASTNISMAESELAQYRYLLPRLTGKGVSMSRLGGGIGTRGPGETKLETDRRHIEKKIDTLKKRLEQFKKNSDVRMKNRENAFGVCLVGYTNAGKTRLMSSLVREGFVSDDKLFTTLDTVTRKLSKSVILTDTVGFLGELPHEIIKSFSLTIEEAARADLKLVVIDVSDKYVRETVEDIHSIMRDLGLDAKRRIYVFNKTDLLVDESLIGEFFEKYPDSVFVSAKTKENLPLLKEMILKEFYQTLDHFKIKIDPAETKAITYIAKNGHEVRERMDRDLLEVDFFLSKKLSGGFKKTFAGRLK